MSLRRLPFNLDVFSLRGHLVKMLVHLGDMFSCFGARNLERASHSHAHTGSIWWGRGGFIIRLGRGPLGPRLG